MQIFSHSCEQRVSEWGNEIQETEWKLCFSCTRERKTKKIEMREIMTDREKTAAVYIVSKRL